MQSWSGAAVDGELPAGDWRPVAKGRSCSLEYSRWAMLLRSSRTLRWREEMGRSLRAEAKRVGDMGVSEDMLGVVGVG